MTPPDQTTALPASRSEADARAARKRRLTEHRRRRLRRHGRRAYIRSVYFLPSLCTLGNAISGFGAIYVASLDATDRRNSLDSVTRFFADHNFVAAAYLIFLAMLFDALDGRLARFARHTTDFGGQLDSLADVISFGVAPAFIMLEVFKAYHPSVPPHISRLLWSVGALYMSCAAMRLARFNVSNEHGEQHHFSFLGLPSPGAGGTVVAMILMQQEIAGTFGGGHWVNHLAVWLLPAVVLMTGLLMISNIRYPHLVNRYMRGKKSIGTLLLVVTLLLALVVAHRYVLAVGTFFYAISGMISSSYLRLRRKPPVKAPSP